MRTAHISTPTANDIDAAIIKIFVASVITLLMNSAINPPSLLSHNTLQFVQQPMCNYGYMTRNLNII